MPESNEHQARRHAIKAVAQTISNRPENRYQHKDLDRLPIQILPMPLSAEGDPLFDSEFFWPYQKPLPDPDEEIEFSPSSPKEALDPMDEAHILSYYFGHYITDATLIHKVDWQHNPRQYDRFPSTAQNQSYDVQMTDLSPGPLSFHVPSASLILRTPSTGAWVV